MTLSPFDKVRTPTLFAQIMGLVLASLVATAIVGAIAIIASSQQDERFSVGDVLKAVRAHASVKSDVNNRYLSVSYKADPPPAMGTGQNQFGFQQFVEPGIAQELNVDRSQVRYWVGSRTTLLTALSSVGRNGGGGRGDPGRGDPGRGNPGRGDNDGPPRGPGFGGGPNGPGGPGVAGGQGGPPPANGAPANPPNRGGRGGGISPFDLASQLAPLLTTPEQKKALADWRARFAQLQQQQQQQNGQARAIDSVRIGPVFKVAVKQPDGRWLTVEPSRAFGLYSWQITSLGVLLISIALVSPFAWLLARRLSQPLVAFAAAAERLGRDPRSPPLEIKGSAEVRAAVHAFNEMQEKLRRYVEDRTAMVAAIAHDLRTPLTRVRFRIDALPDDIRPKLEEDIDQMDEMISSTLAFARDAALPEKRVKLDLTSLVETVFDQAQETGAKVSFEEPIGKPIIIEGDQLSLKRLFTNLVDNAVKYGKRANGRISLQDGRAVIDIEDAGSGIPDAELERVFEPFYRREPSRNRKTGGTGLGLAVVRSIALAHGGDVVLRNRPEGGLLARVTLPV